VVSLTGTAHAGDVTGSFVAGFDSFTEKYSVVEKDTTDELNEFRARISLGYLQGEFLRDYVQIEGQTMIGEESIETAGRLNLLRRNGPYRFSFNNEFSYRTYNDNSNYTFANDFARYDGRVYLQREMVEDVFLRLTDRVELIDFDQRTDFDYDYVRNQLQLSGVYEKGLTTSYGAGVGLTTKSIPDTTEIAYKAFTGRLEYRHTAGLNRQVFVMLNGERRSFNDEPTKSPYWSLYSDALAQPLTWRDFGIQIDNTFESFFYDNDTDVFFDYVENRSALQFMYYRSYVFSAGVGPTFGFLGSSFAGEDEYTEVGAKLSVDYGAGGSLWISASYEPGRRDYRLDSEDSAETIFSDFNYHRFMVFASARLFNGANVNLFVSHEPEDHELEDDDSTATLFSIDVSYSF
jgi:hypothetical protein